MNREQFVGAVPRDTSGGIVYCNAEPERGKVDYPPHDCLESMEAGDRIIVHYQKMERSGGEEWVDQFRFCANCTDARELPEPARKRGEAQAVVGATLEAFEGTVDGKFYEDAVRLQDVEVLASSPRSEVRQPE